MRHPAIGSLTPAQFLRGYWQKRPLHIEAALPEMRDQFSAVQMRALARRDDVESRLVTRAYGRWHVAHGPFKPSAIARPTAKHWSLLVQGVDLHLDKARALLDRFNFVPYARLDDVMLSLAPPGGGVGPHFDSYDVFLLQIHGRRRWRIGAPRDLRLVEGAPLRILRDFRPQREIEVNPGDLLYLPPHYAHDGIATTDCITCSIGFRAPSRQDLVAAFVQWLPEKLSLPGRYRDPDLSAQTHPARIGPAMIEQVEKMLGAMKWRREHVQSFLGEYLTEPKPHVWFDAPEDPLPRHAFVDRAHARGVRLSRKTRMLYHAQRIFINGESLVAPAAARQALRALADKRELAAGLARSGWLAAALYEWYRSGYVDLRPR